MQMIFRIFRDPGNFLQKKIFKIQEWDEIYFLQMANFIL